VDFELRCDRWVRRVFTLLGAGPNRTVIRVADGTLYVKFGRSFRMDIALEDIKSARMLSERQQRSIVWAIGVHQTSDGWLINGSRHGVVELRLNPPVKPKKVPMSPLFGGPVRSLYLSLTEPDAFITALKPVS
jgi:hypothetical protein